ncbi:MAG: hypothetical protein ABSC34_02750 [Acidimicrobiales bacterium]|jgi:hypothetical protein
MTVVLTSAALLCSTVMIASSASSATVHKHKAKAPIVKKVKAVVAPTATTPIVLTSPALSGVAPLPGPVAAPSTPSATISDLSVTPSSGLIGTPMTIVGAGLPATTSVQIEWATANATWVVGADPSTVNYLGTNYNKINVVLDTVVTTAAGGFSVTIDAPKDFGGAHSIYAVVGTTELSEGTFTTLRTVTISPTSGPVGTPITITYSGLGDSLYTGGASLLYDNHYVGEMMANWTRGVATATIRASGAVGPHTIQIGNAISYLYLNVPQSPIPYTNGAVDTFTVTADDGAPAASIDWPASVAPTLAQVTTLDEGGLGAKSTATATASVSSGPEGTSVTINASGLPANVSTQFEWATVVGNRVNCASTCWAFTTQSLAAAVTPSANALSDTITIPSPALGGWHAIQLVQGTKVVAQVPFYVKESIVGYEAAGSTTAVTSLSVVQGQPFQIHIEGVGWTQLDNTVGVDYDNSYIGYGCGFNSNGDVVLNLIATGAPGTHLIDLYPMLYSLSPSFASTPYGMVPVLTYAQDDPGLALGYQLPAMRFAITVVAP